MSAWLVYGQRSDGELLHISEALRGEACGCFCPHCQTPLAAKKGTVKLHHFAHLGPTCAYISAYDFLHVDSYVDTALSLSQWVRWKEEDIAQMEERLESEREEVGKQKETVMKLIHESRDRLVEISQPHPSRKLRSKVRQANFDVLQQWDAYLDDHNAELPDLERVRDLDSVQYLALNYIQLNRWEGRYATGLSAWPNELWHEEYQDRDWIPWWLAKGGLALLNDYGPLRRKLVTTQLHLEAFRAEKLRNERFYLYFLLIEFDTHEPLFKVGITSRTNLDERLAEIRADLSRYGVHQIKILYTLKGRAYLESYFKRKYAVNQRKLGKLTEYFAFDDLLFAEIQVEFGSLVQQDKKLATRGHRIKQGMDRARELGIHVGRPAGQERSDEFLLKPKARQIQELIQQYPDLSARQLAKRSGIALNTVLKVIRLEKNKTNSNN